MMRFLMALILSLAALANTAQASETTLKSAVIVESKYIKLGDLFDNAGDKATTNVAYAPAPGKKAVFKAQWLYNVARAHSLPWRPLNLNARSVVEREGQIIHRDEIEDKLVAALADYGIGKDVDVDFGVETFSEELICGDATGDDESFCLCFLDGLLRFAD